MGKNNFRKKGNLILYEKFKLNQILSMKKEDILTERSSSRSIQKEKKIKKYIESGIPVTVVITSLYANSGCTFISDAFEEYLKSLNYSVLRLNKDNYDPAEFKGYHFIIADIGKYKDIPKALQDKISKAHFKIMVCLSSDIYLKELSRFIQTEINSDQWKFFFNLVPKREYRRISDMMEDYEYFMVPALNPEDQTGEKELRCCFKSVLLEKV